MEDLKAVVNSSDNPVGVPLSQVLDGPQLMSVRMEATTTQGQSLSDEALQTVIRACEMVLQLDQAKKILTDYVQSRMNMFAPNLTALIGSETAALLVNACGGLKGLAKTPSCNIPNIGWKKQTFGLATNVGVRQKGYLFNSPIVQNIPNDLKTQAMRIVAAKLVLAARCDQVHTTPDGATGEKLKEDCEERLEKLTEAAPNRGVRALPAPDDKPSRKRGGRRARKAKEQYAMTELRKAQNRVQFGKEEQEVGYGTGESTKGLGMVGQAGDGRVRITQVDQRTKAKLSKKNPGWGGATPANGLASSLRGFGQGAAPSVLKNHGLRTTGVGTGTSSVIAFTPIQGLELINPTVKDEMARKRKADEDRWFKSGTFTQVGGSQSQSNGQAEPKVDSAGFKVPAIPAIKRLKAEK
ncbi:Nop domain-containing protein [Trichodelitschia bisporula]|uniref:Nop domain-containing protein n=1 Tax=Trichodelitschia bisporula TaxID=703511 RepID=A0A6G1IAD7_9PEZI|nr:Nop domain-containing protein [Trichodelitschia bisporula]